MTSDTSIFVGSSGDTAWVRIEGVATKDTSSCIRQFVSEKFSKGLREFNIDLELCQLIDSTFIGILTGLAGNIADDCENGGVNLIHANERNVKSICKLGLDNILNISKETDHDKNRCELSQLEGADLAKIEKSEMILKAHEDLCSANEDTAEEFKDVLHYLRKDLDRSSSK